MTAPATSGMAEPATRRGDGTVSSALLGLAILILAGCADPPKLTNLGPVVAPSRTAHIVSTLPGDQGVMISLTGDGFTQDSRVLVDGFVDGNKDATLQTFDPYYVSVASVSFIDAQHLTATLNVSPDAPAGTYLVAVGVLDTGVSNTELFVVSCDGCPPPPFLEDVVNLSAQQTFTRGNRYDLRFDGMNLNNSPVISISGSGVTFGVLSNAQSGSFTTTMTVASDAETGLHEVRVTTAGGSSNRLLLPIYSAPPVAPAITTITPNCVPPGVLTALTITGTNFDVGMDLHADQQDIQVSEITFVNRNTYTAKVLVPNNFPAGVFGLQLLGVNAASSVFNIAQPCGQLGPLLSSITPAAVTKGSGVFLKCQGVGFISGGSLRGQMVATGTGISVVTAFKPINGNADQVLTAQIIIASNADASAQISVQNSFTGLFSNTLPLTINDKIAGRPFITGFTMSDPNGLAPGGDIDLTISGQNLQIVDGATATVPGVTFSQLTLLAGGTQLQVHVHADASAPLTADEATNFFLTSPAGPSNLTGLFISPPP